MKRIAIKTVDAFTTVAFGGGPAGIVTDASSLTEGEMQTIAREMSISETVFVVPPTEPKADFWVRFFTPTDEVALVGHATIATFFTLANEGRIKLTGDETTVHQQTGAGVLPVTIFTKGGQVERVVMTQNLPVIEDVAVTREEVAEALGLSPADLGDTPLQRASTGLFWMMVPIRTLKASQSITPDLAKIIAISKRCDVVGMATFTMETVNPEATIHTRVFGPAIGIPEDPACGTGNGAISTYMFTHGLVPKDRQVYIRAEQALEMKRPSDIHVELDTDGEQITRVRVGGKAVTVLTGEIMF